MPRYASFLMFLLLPVFAGCKPVLEIESKGYTENGTQCIQREAVLVAREWIDLETAADAVISRCNNELHSKEQALIASYPGLEERIREQWKAITAIRFRQALRAVERARTS